MRERPDPALLFMFWVIHAFAAILVLALFRVSPEFGKAVMRDAGRYIESYDTSSPNSRYDHHGNLKLAPDSTR